MKKQIKKIISLGSMLCAVLITSTGCGDNYDVKTSENSALTVTSESKIQQSEESSSTFSSTTTEIKTEQPEISTSTIGKSIAKIEVNQTNTTAVSQNTKQNIQATEEVSKISTQATLIEVTESNQTYETQVTEPPTVDYDSPIVQEAVNIMGALDFIDEIGACMLPYYEDESYCNENGTMYYKVAKTPYANTSDLRFFMETYMTDSFIAERYSSILDTDEPVCIDVNNELYTKCETKSGGFGFSDTEPKIENTFENGYSILAEYDDYGSKEVMDIRVIKEDGLWKIIGITFGL